MMLAFLNGRFVPNEQALLPLHDAGFVSGATVTDLVRTFRHRLFRLEDHVTRFRRSCELCRVPLLTSDTELMQAANELVEHNARLIPAASDLSLVMVATPGPFGAYAGVANDGPPTLAMHTFPLPFERYRHRLTSGCRLVTIAGRWSGAVDPRAKQRSRMNWWLAAQQAHEIDPAADALLLDADGFVMETASANLIVVRGGELFTPPADAVLSGITMRVVRDLGFPIRERQLTADDCRTADELLLTCTSWCVAGVSRFDGWPVRWPGPVSGRALRALSEHVGVDVAAQVQAEQIQRPNPPVP